MLKKYLFSELSPYKALLSDPDKDYWVSVIVLLLISIGYLFQLMLKWH